MAAWLSSMLFLSCRKTCTLTLGQRVMKATNWFTAVDAGRSNAGHQFHSRAHPTLNTYQMDSQHCALPAGVDNHA